MRPVNIEIVSVLEDIVSSIIPYAKVKNINVIFDTEIEELVMSVDPDKIERMMLNLLSNSIKFNKNDGSIITMVKIKDNYLNIEVIDTGIGIAKENISKIFDKFTQVEDIMIRQNEGSGIGLSLVKYFTEAHGIVSVLEDIVSSIIPYAKVKNINVIFDTEIEELVMSVDPDKIERMMLNLLSNSIKFNKNDGSIITMVKIKDNYLNIEVIDTGIGIAKENISKIFDKFTQVEDIMIRQNEGSGIGLSLVKYFTEAHGGTISVESELNKGSRFIVRIPIIKQAKLSMNYYEKNQNDIVVGAEVEFSDIYA